ncbi:HD family phosphohydrolase [Candidatus Latescibacterota bacterium]
MKKKSKQGKKSQKSPHRTNLRAYLKQSVIPRILLLAVLTVIIAILHFSLTSRSTQWVGVSYPELREGDISPRRIIAPFDFVVPKPTRQLEQERRDAASAILPVFLFEEAVYDSIASHFDILMSTLTLLSGNPEQYESALGIVVWNAPAITRDAADSLIHYIESAEDEQMGRIRQIIRTSFLDLSELLIVPDENYPSQYTDRLFVLENGDTVSVDMTIAVPEAADVLQQTFRGATGDTVPAPIVYSLTTLMQQYLVPNLSYESFITNERRNVARDAVPVNSVSFKRNELIIDANEPVTANQVEVLNVLKREVARQYFVENRVRHYAVAGGKSLVGFGILGVVAMFLSLFRRKVFASFSKLLLIATISLLPLMIGYYTALNGTISEFLIPVAIASMLTTILFDAELGLLVTIGVSLIVASFLPAENLRMFLIYFLAGSMGVFTVGHVRHRREFYRSMIAIPLAMVLTTMATYDWIASASFSDVGNDIFLGALNGFFCPIIAIGLLPILESLFKVTTDITLLELSDLNTPLLRELAVKAPGTFSSVIVVGMLAEAAAEKVGANPLLCRVGSYYHDIGKMISPEYYIENQLGTTNPHDRLSPHMSALILASHVKEGSELGLRHGLPEAVLDIIKQHHGTSLMQSFYRKALDAEGKQQVDESNFRYPGPKPQTREAAIVMLADLSEAASRTVKEKSPGRLRTLVNTIIHQRFVDGELDESNLTLKDLHNIEESFLPILVSSHHGRIEYPWQKDQAREGEKTKQPHTENEKPHPGKESVRP